MGIGILGSSLTTIGKIIKLELNTETVSQAQY